MRPNAGDDGGKGLFFAKDAGKFPVAGSQAPGQTAGESARASPAGKSGGRRTTKADAGRRVAGYFLVSQLGQGRSGVTYRARHAESGYEVALKILEPRLSAGKLSDDGLVAALRQAATVNHLNIAPIHEVGETDGRYYVVRELVNGRSLTTLLREEGPLSRGRALQVAIQVAVALDHAHTCGVAHGGVHGHNVIVGWDDRATLVDFVASGPDEAPLLARPGASERRAGSLRATAAEEPSSPGRDRRAFVALFRDLVTGALALETPGAGADAGPRVLPPQVEEIFARALDDSREDGYANCAAVVHAVSAALSDQVRSPVARAPAVPARPRSGPKARPGVQEPALPWRFLLPVASAVVLTIAAAIALILASQGQAEPGLVSSPAAATPPAAVFLATAAAQASPIAVAPTPELTAVPTTVPTAAAVATPAVAAGEPGGTLVVVRATEGGASSLYTLSPDGKNLARLAGLPGGWHWAPAASPDGQWLAVATGDPAKGNIAVVRRDGREFRVVATGGEFALSSPWWLPDGRVAFTASTGARSEIFASSLQGGEATQLTRTAGAIWETRIPSTSRSGLDLAFSGKLGDYFRVFVQSPGTSPRAVSPERANAYTPMWSPDGSAIAFSATLVDGRTGIFTVQPDGTGLTHRAQSAPGTWACCPAWSPDGTWLAFIGDLGVGQSPNHGNVYLVARDGGQPRKVLGDGATYYWRPCWLP